MKRKRGRKKRKVGDVFYIKNYRSKKINGHWKINSGTKTVEYFLSNKSVINTKSDFFNAKILNISYQERQISNLYG